MTLHRDNMVRLVSESGYSYYAMKSKRNKNPGNKSAGKLAMRKYDPILKKHVLFEEKRMPSNK